MQGTDFKRDEDYSVYLAGPMRNQPHANFPLFDRADERIVEIYHWKTFNPAQMDRDHGVSEEDAATSTGFDQAMRRDLVAISLCDGIVLLPGWEASAGVEIELVAAKACGLSVYFYTEDDRWGWMVAPTTYEEVERRKAGAFGSASQLYPIQDPYEAEGKFDGAAGKNVVRKFDTGATRDSEDGKYDFEGFLSPAVLMAFGEYMHSHRKMRDGSLRASDNWQKGIPRDVYMKSLVRHMLDLWMLHRGLDAVRPETGEAVNFDETLAALLFNVQGYFHEYLKDQQKEAA